MQYHTDQRERTEATTEPMPADPPVVGRAPAEVDGDGSPERSELVPADPPAVGRASATVDGDGFPERSERADGDPATTGARDADAIANDDASASAGAGSAAVAAASPVPFQERWQEIQLRFVDDPGAAASQAEQLVAEVVDTISAMLSARKDEIDGWSRADQPDTEEFRQVIRRYRELLDQLVSIAETGRGGSASTP